MEQFLVGKGIKLWIRESDSAYKDPALGYAAADVYSSLQNRAISKVSSNLHPDVLSEVEQELYQSSSPHHLFDYLRGNTLTFGPSDMETDSDGVLRATKIRKKHQETLAAHWDEITKALRDFKLG